jgi:hypothetical protein
MKITAKLLSAVMPALLHLSRFPNANVAYVCRKRECDPAVVAAILEESSSEYRQFNEDALVALAKKYGAKVPSHATEASAGPAPKSETPTVEIEPPAAAAPAEATRSSAGLAMPTSNIGLWLEQQHAKITGRVHCFQVEVTPAIATAWLAFNSGNRHPSRAKIRRFATAMKTGRWAVNGETIKFSITGRLIDGQSRLMAVILANCPIILEVRAGLPDIAQQSMDVGEMRKGAHTLEMLGEVNPSITAAALKLLWYWGRGWLAGVPFGAQKVMENSEIAPLLEKHAALRSSVGWTVAGGNKIDLMLLRSEAAFFHYLFGTTDAELRDHFFEALCEGVGLTKVSPVYHLRERLLADRGGVGSKDRKVTRYGLVIKAWNAARAAKQVTSLSHSSKEPFPAIDGIATPEREKTERFVRAA